jgi:hypothetical protein
VVDREAAAREAATSEGNALDVPSGPLEASPRRTNLGILRIEQRQRARLPVGPLALLGRAPAEEREDLVPALHREPSTRDLIVLLIVLEEIGIRPGEAREADQIIREIHVAVARADRHDEGARDQVVAEMILDDGHHPGLQRHRDRHARDGELRLGVRGADDQLHVPREARNRAARQPAAPIQPLPLV